MRKSLNKTAFREYILNSIDSSSYEITCNTDKEKINFLMSTFEREKWHDYNKKYFKGNKVLCFAGFIMGMPSYFNIATEWHVIDQLAKDFGLLDQTSKENSFAKFRETWFNRVAIEVFRLHDKLNK